MITTPIFFPVVQQLGFDPLWFGVLFVVNMEMAFLTPPFGLNLFFLKGVAPPDVTMGDIYRSIGPFVAIQAVALIFVMVFPSLATWLPSLMIARGP
jgi:TRAP-type mannitol/chloroaromatic compound transport system permease large subunit